MPIMPRMMKSGGRLMAIALALSIHTASPAWANGQVTRSSATVKEVQSLSGHAPHAKAERIQKLRSRNMHTRILRSLKYSSAGRRHSIASSSRFFPASREPFQQERLLESWRIRPIDGDTFAYGSERIRIQGIDTPEVSEAGGFEATQRLDQLLHEGPVTIVPKAIDKYKRTVAEVYVNRRNVAELLLHEGFGKRS
jgi:hypothetical protein